MSHMQPRPKTGFRVRERGMRKRLGYSTVVSLCNAGYRNPSLFLSRSLVVGNLGGTALVMWKENSDYGLRWKVRGERKISFG